MLKTCVRCVLVSAAAIVLLVDKASLTTMGHAGFFAAIVSILPPPSLALSVFVLASLTILIWMLLGCRVYGRRDLRAGQGTPPGGAESCPG
ncbi:hypothetical protein B0H14DRAFT_2788878 [Mycena olivaceomarginata]|nr:hypothetical protein B0H14DRAFT_2788878 [Mycena olivaceomarginata]